MSRSLNPYTLSQIYTLIQIEEKITFYSEQLEGATVKSYDKDTGQGRQKVESADMDKIESILSAWISAKGYKTGSTGTRVTSVNFQGTRRNGL